uniref:Uncharacterized protein n=1 Tax=Meloidogyne enterolobii TaxID=390850 RepID=A0A6V7TUH7_MELEN|nr:unnamed protein product [Meloidogyne enterolobii]
MLQQQHQILNIMRSAPMMSWSRTWTRNAFTLTESGAKALSTSWS